MLKKPNLFHYATSELSQDAFIAWLLEWANPENKNIDEKLHECSLGLIKSFFEKHEKFMPSSIDSIEINQQAYGIDILAIINKKFALIIEDKVHSSNHSNQLERYSNKILSLNKFYKENVLPIYFKTIEQGEYRKVFDSGYKLFSRTDFLEILNKGQSLGVNNSIFIDYRNYLLEIEEKVKGYLTVPIKAGWPWLSWCGFYSKVQEDIKDGEWGYVPNQTGGFWGFYWNWKEIEDCHLYLQIEENKLCFKIEVKNKEARKEKRQYWFEYFYEEGKKLNLKITRPKRFGNGETMTVAIIEDYRQANKEGLVDLPKTVEFLRNLEKIY